MKIIKGNRKLLFSIGTYTLVNVINQAIPFLLLPLLTHYLTTKDYGILTNLQSMLTLIVPLIGINLPSAITRQYVKPEVNLKNYLVSSLRAIFVSFVLITLASSVFAEFLSEKTYIPVEIIYFLSFYALFDTLIESLLSLLRMEDKPTYYGALRIARTLLDIGLSLSLILVYKYDWFGRFLGIYTACIFLGIYALIYFYKKEFFKGKYTKTDRSHFLKFGLTLIPHSMSGVVIMYSDKIIITEMIGIEENGIYSVAFTIGMVISLIQNSFNQAWVPWLFKKLQKGVFEDKRKLVKITYLYMVGILGLVLILWLLAPIVYMFLGKDFSGGLSFVAIIGLGFAFNGMYKMMVNYIFFAEKNHIISFIAIFITALNIVLNIIFIKAFGLIGSAYATTLTFFCQFLIAWFLSNRIYPMPWFNFKK